MTHPGNQGGGGGGDKTAEIPAMKVDQLTKDVETEVAKLKFYPYINFSNIGKENRKWGERPRCKAVGKMY